MNFRVKKTEISYRLPAPRENLFLAKKRFSPDPFPKFAAEYALHSLIIVVDEVFTGTFKMDFRDQQPAAGKHFTGTVTDNKKLQAGGYLQLSLVYCFFADTYPCSSQMMSS